MASKGFDAAAAPVAGRAPQWWALATSALLLLVSFVLSAACWGWRRITI